MLPIGHVYICTYIDPSLLPPQVPLVLGRSCLSARYIKLMQLRDCFVLPGKHIGLMFRNLEVIMDNASDPGAQWRQGCTLDDAVIIGLYACPSSRRGQKIRFNGYL